MIIIIMCVCDNYYVNACFNALLFQALQCLHRHHHHCHQRIVMQYVFLTFHKKIESALWNQQHINIGYTCFIVLHYNCSMMCVPIYIMCIIFEEDFHRREGGWVLQSHVSKKANWWVSGSIEKDQRHITHIYMWCLQLMCRNHVDT